MSGVSNPSIVIVEYGFPIFFIVRLLNEFPPLISMFLGPKFPSDSMTMLSAEAFSREMDDERRFVVPDEIANMVKYLISEEAKGVTGQAINICAGLTCGC